MPSLSLPGDLSAEIPAQCYAALSTRPYRVIYLRGKPYPYRGERRDGHNRWRYLHQDVWEMLHGPIPRGYMIDHADGNPLRCTEDNLRLVTPQQNAWNRRKRSGCSSRFKGVDKVPSGWRGRCDNCHLGIFREEIDAACAYNWAALPRFGEYADYNDVPMPPEFWRAVEAARREHATLVVLDAGHTDWHMRDACAAGLAVVEGVAP